MRGPRSAAAREAISLYGSAPASDRFHVRARWWSCPLEQVAARVPPTGRVLDVGCGHGLLSCYLALESPEREVLGVDIDERKISLANEAAAQLNGRGAHLSFRSLDGATFAPESWDTIVVNDVLYLLEQPDRQRLLDQCAAALRPGGVLVLKEVDHRPAWKYRLTVIQETLSTRILRITAGQRVAIAEPLEFVEQLRAHGLDVTGERIDHGYLHPHVIVVARRST